MNREKIINLAVQAKLIRKGERFTAPHRWGLTEVETFANLIETEDRQRMLKLWMLLDDIDTASDIAKSDDKLYRSLCDGIQKKRWEILSGEEFDIALAAVRGSGL